MRLKIKKIRVKKYSVVTWHITKVFMFRFKVTSCIYRCRLISPDAGTSSDSAQRQMQTSDGRRMKESKRGFRR